MSDLSVRVSAGWAADPDSPIRAQMSPGLTARCAAADFEEQRQAEREERARQARIEVAHERLVTELALEKSRTEGVPYREALRSLGNTPREFVEQRSALMDVEDLRQQAEQAQLMRRLAIDAGLLDVSDSEPSERALGIAAEVAVMTAPKDEPFDPQAAARGIRGKWLRRHYRGME
jgi:hypothetical protein